MIYSCDWSTARSASSYDWDYYHQGGRFDRVTKLEHFRHRDYSPSMMRWLNMDPIGLGAGDSNLYRYEGGGPVGRLDPSGLQVGLPPRPQIERDLNDASYVGTPIAPGMTAGERLGINPAPFPMLTFDPPTPRDKWAELGQVSGEVAANMLGIFVEPWNWLMTAREIWNDPGSPLSYAGLLPVVPAAIGKGGKAVKRAANAGKICDKGCDIKRAERLGREGEQAVDTLGPKVGIEIPNTDRLRFPDKVDFPNNLLVEVKNVGHQNFSAQLRDYLSYSQANGMTFELWTRPSTGLSGPLQDAINRKNNIRKDIPGTK